MLQTKCNKGKGGCAPVYQPVKTDDRPKKTGGTFDKQVAFSMELHDYARKRIVH